jgi:hypothetical protein
VLDVEYVIAAVLSSVAFGAACSAACNWLGSEFTKRFLLAAFAYSM